MTTALSKRQQARNERTLQDLIKNVPGNNLCADCQARNPGWASWSLGIFLCMRCAALHRKLGTHISKVKSLSMDSWSNEQVENMKNTGNIASNRIFNPQNAKPPIPFDVDEADSAMERFIRQKYQNHAMQEGRVQAPLRHNTGSSGSDDHPPPLPPKNSTKFGFRSASSIFPMSSKAKREAVARAHLESSREQQRTPSPPLRNKASRVFGTTVSSDRLGIDNLEQKLAALRQMGFSDDERNISVLKSSGGSIDKALDKLVKMGGESDKPSRSRTPLSATAGITIKNTAEKESPRSPTNPFDMPRALPQSSQSTGTLARPGVHDHQQINGNNYQGPIPTNPFGLAPSQSQYNLHEQYTLDHSLQNLSLNPSQPLFPNHTGGFPNSQPFQTMTTSPMPTIPQHYQASVYDNVPQQQPIPQNQNYNPFLQQQPQQQVFNQAIDNTYSNNPFGQPQRAQTLPQQAFYDQSQQQQQTYYTNQQPQFLQQQQEQYQMANRQTNPYNNQFQQSAQNAQAQQQYMQFPQQTQQLLPQQTGRADKSSILALYNYPQLAPVAPQQQSSTEQAQSQDPNYQGFSSGSVPTEQQPRSISNPLASYASGSRNPFLANNGGFAQNGSVNMGQGPNMGNGMNGMNGPGQRGHVSQESMSVDVGDWHGQNGRHSPDAFANLSARSMS